MKDHANSLYSQFVVVFVQDTEIHNFFSFFTEQKHQNSSLFYEKQKICFCK